MPSSTVVPGDIVVVSTGDRVAADMRLIVASGLCMDESMFTGEPEPQSKQVVPEGADPSGPLGMALQGTFVVSGHGRGIVTATGSKTEHGNVAKLVEEANGERERSTLQQQMDSLGQTLSIVSLALIAAIGGIGLYRGQPWLETLQVAISLAVAAIPEGLPVVTTVTLAVGVQRLAENKAVCRRLQSLTDLGSARLVVVTDKTGTLTENKMTAVTAVSTEIPPSSAVTVLASDDPDAEAIAAAVFATVSPDMSTALMRRTAAAEVTGTHASSVAGSVVSRTLPGRDYEWISLGWVGGGREKGIIGDSGSGPSAHLKALLEGAAVCSNAHEDGKGGLVGGATEVALVMAAGAAGLSRAGMLYTRMGEIAFTHERKWMGVKVRAVEGGSGLTSPPGSGDRLHSGDLSAALAAGEDADGASALPWGAGDGDDSLGAAVTPLAAVEPAGTEESDAAARPAAADGDGVLSAGDGEMVLVKGAPEAVMAMCARVLGASGKAEPLGDAARARLDAAQAAAASSGLRVLAVAAGTRASAGRAFSDAVAGASVGADAAAAGSDLTLLGLICLRDPPRRTASKSVALLRRCGVRCIMLTGDARSTAVAIAGAVGITTRPAKRGAAVADAAPGGDDGTADEEGGADGYALGGAELDCMTPGAVDRAVARTDVFYRVSPAHKLQVVRALKARGLVVACFGDGVNDGPALKSAQVGVAMGLHGTEVAKEAADVVLLDDRFETLVRAVEAGRGIFRNVRAFVRFQVASSTALLVVVTACFLVGTESPLNPSMVLLANVLIDGPPAQTLGLEPVPPASVQRPLRLEDEQIITPRLFARTMATGAIMATTLLASFWHQLTDGAITPRDSTLVFASFVVLDMASAYAARCGDRYIFQVDPFSNVPFVIAVVCVLVFLVLSVHLPPLQAMLSTEALSLHDWATIFLQALFVLLADEVLKPCLASEALGMANSPSSTLAAQPSDAGAAKEGEEAEGDSGTEDEAEGAGEGAAMLAKPGRPERMTRRRPQ